MTRFVVPAFTITCNEKIDTVLYIYKACLLKIKSLPLFLQDDYFPIYIGASFTYFKTYMPSANNKRIFFSFFINFT